MKQISFKYINHRGEIRDRSVLVDAIEFHRDPAFGYQPGWFISGIDTEKQERRSFALSRMIIGEQAWVRNIATLVRF